MKRAVILHGTSGHPTHNWQPWLKQELERAGYTVWSPELPDNDRPNQSTYSRYFRDSDWDFSDNLVIGHSSGATAILNLLTEDWFPHVRSVVLVGAFLNEKLLGSVEWCEKGMFDKLLPSAGFDPHAIRSGADNFYFIHGQKDGYCDPLDTKALCDSLGGTFVLISDQGHFSSPTTSIPEIITTLRQAHDL
jgi:predicted alpha/beta hydrolase family esterase